MDQLRIIMNKQQNDALSLKQRNNHWLTINTIYIINWNGDLPSKQTC